MELSFHSFLYFFFLIFKSQYCSSVFLKRISLFFNCGKGKEEHSPNLQHIMQMRVSFLTSSHHYPDIVGLHRQFFGVQTNHKEDLFWHCDFSSSLPSIHLVLPVQHMISITEKGQYKLKIST